MSDSKDYFSDFEIYKRIIIHKSEDLLSLDFQVDESRDSIFQNTHIDFVNNKLLYTGDYGTYVFGKDILDIKSFFCTKEPNYQYWSGKLEAYSESYEITEYEDFEDIICKVTDFFKSYHNLYFDEEKDYSLVGLDEDEIQELKDRSEELKKDLEIALFFESDYSVNSVVDVVKETLSDFQSLNDYDDRYNLDDEDLYNLLRIDDYSPRYKRLCNFCCWVENNLDKWFQISGDNGTVFLKNC